MEQPHVVVLFGATGDLARRKLLPGMLRLWQAGLLERARIIGTSLEDLDTEGFVKIAHEACAEHGRGDVSEETWGQFAGGLSFVPQSAGPAALAEAVREAESALAAEHEGDVARLHYLSVPPRAALDVVAQLDEAGLVERSRVIMEKPFGTDEESAKRLNPRLHEVFDESQVFRIDHFLARRRRRTSWPSASPTACSSRSGTATSSTTCRSTCPRPSGLEGRTAFYEATGAYRDMVVTHLMQVLAFMAMEPPTSLAPDPISDEKLKVFRSMRPLEPHNVVRGQYAGTAARSDVADDSDTETFVALKVEIDNWRWAGVPFFLRTGKKLAEGARIISIAFEEPPLTMFPRLQRRHAGPDHLTFDLADQSKMSLSFYGKRPGPDMKLEKLSMQFATHETVLLDWRPRGVRTPHPRRDAR